MAREPPRTWTWTVSVNASAFEFAVRIPLDVDFDWSFDLSFAGDVRWEIYERRVVWRVMYALPRTKCRAALRTTQHSALSAESKFRWHWQLASGAAQQVISNQNQNQIPVSLMGH